MTNRNKTPKLTNFSVTREKINTIIERDIALTVLIMLAGLLLRNDSGLRGFPAGWLYTGGDPALHSRPEYFFIALATSVAITLICELAVSIIGRATESPYTNGSGTQYTADAGNVYANTYDDSYVSADNSSYKTAYTKKSLKSVLASKSETPINTAKSMQSWDSKEAKAKDKNPEFDIKIPDLPLKRKENPIFKELNIKPPAASGGRASSAYRKSGSAASDAAMKGVLTAFALITIFVIGITVSIFTTEDTTNYDEYEDEFSYDFYTESEFMQDNCDKAFEILMQGDMDALNEIGNGTPAKLLSMADWSYVSYNEENRAMTLGDTDIGFIRYFVETDDGSEYMVAFKFVGGDLAYDESTAVLTGIAACPYDVWNDYDPDDDWDEFAEQVNEQMAYVGDVEYMDENILIW